MRSPRSQGYQAAAVDRRRSSRWGWLDEANALRDTGQEPLPEALAGVHDSVEMIHLFLDGNGRAGTEEISGNALRAAAVRGRLRAVKGDDGVWRSSEKRVQEYREATYRR